MNRKKILISLSSTAVATVLLAATSVAHAWNMGNMMNPGEWFDDDDDDYYRHGRYYGRGYGPYGPYGGYGYGPYGYGGYGGPWGRPMMPGYGGYGTDDMDQWLWGLRHMAKFESLLAEAFGSDPTFAFLIEPFNINTDVLPLADDLSGDDPRRDLPWFPRHGDMMLIVLEFHRV